MSRIKYIKINIKLKLFNTNKVDNIKIVSTLIVDNILLHIKICDHTEYIF